MTTIYSSSSSHASYREIGVPAPTNLPGARCAHSLAAQQSPTSTATTAGAAATTASTTSAASAAAVSTAGNLWLYGGVGFGQAGYGGECSTTLFDYYFFYCFYNFYYYFVYFFLRIFTHTHFCNYLYLLLPAGLSDVWSWSRHHRQWSYHRGTRFTMSDDVRVGNYDTSSSSSSSSSASSMQPGSRYHATAVIADVTVTTTTSTAPRSRLWLIGGLGYGRFLLFVFCFFYIVIRLDFYNVSCILTPSTLTTTPTIHVMQAWAAAAFTPR
jgi:hypothetical protein